MMRRVSLRNAAAPISGLLLLCSCLRTPIAPEASGPENMWLEAQGYEGPCFMLVEECPVGEPLYRSAVIQSSEDEHIAQAFSWWYREGNRYWVEPEEGDWEIYVWEDPHNEDCYLVTDKPNSALEIRVCPCPWR